MKIAIASGKGGTGKTLVSVALALSAPKPVRLIDCDVEEPNAALFIKPQFNNEQDITILVPEVNMDKCDNCGKCNQICQFNAIITISEKTMVFENLCHSCGGCYLVCPQAAISEIPKTIGKIKLGSGNGIDFVQGELNVGESVAIPAIKAAKRFGKEDKINILDSPPGTACPMIETVKDADYVLLVTDPTPFGVNDFKLAAEAVTNLDLPFGVLINRADLGDTSLDKYCETNRIPIHLKIDNDRLIAEAYAIGDTLFDVKPGYEISFRKLWKDIQLHLTDKK
jgi:MinD superfamily P-loop ATPase